MVWSVSGSTTGSYSGTESNGNGTQVNQSNTRRLSVQDEKYLQDLMRQFGAGSQADTAGAKKQAIADSAGAINDLFTQFKNTALPDIMSNQAKTSGYGATTTQLLANDAFSSAVNKGAQLRLATIADYENRALEKSKVALGGLSTSLQSLLAANEVTNEAGQYTTNARSRTTNISHTASGSFGK